MSELSDKIMALKAFYLGSDIRQSTSKNDILVQLEKKVNDIHQINDKNEIKIFYLLIISDILRENNQEKMIEIRKQAKDLADELGSNFYYKYMNIVNATQTQNRAYGLSEGYIANRGILRRRVEHHEYRFQSYSFLYDEAMAAVDLSEINLNIELQNFLFKLKISDILENQEILCRVMSSD